MVGNNYDFTNLKNNLEQLSSEILPETIITEIKLPTRDSSQQMTTQVIISIDFPSLIMVAV
jgi:hypothetical protein